MRQRAAAAAAATVQERALRRCVHTSYNAKTVLKELEGRWSVYKATELNRTKTK